VESSDLGILDVETWNDMTVARSFCATRDPISGGRGGVRVEDEAGEELGRELGT
jgi:hypothetical protein